VWVGSEHGYARDAIINGIVQQVKEELCRDVTYYAC
jgi:hypothetical protein